MAKHGRVPGHTLRRIESYYSTLSIKAHDRYYPICDCGWTQCCDSKEEAQKAYTKHLAEMR